MAVLITIFVVLGGGAGTALARLLRDRDRRATETQEWIEYLQEDLRTSL